MTNDNRALIQGLREHGRYLGHVPDRQGDISRVIYRGRFSMLLTPGVAWELLNRLDKRFAMRSAAITIATGIAYGLAVGRLWA